MQVESESRIQRRRLYSKTVEKSHDMSIYLSRTMHTRKALLIWSKGQMSNKLGKNSTDEEDEQPTRLLAAHYLSVLTVSRIGTFTTVLAALQARMPNGTKRIKKLVAALIALMHYRIDTEKMKYKRNYGTEKKLAEYLVRSSIAWLLYAFYMTYVYLFTVVNNKKDNSEGNSEESTQGDNANSPLLALFIVSLYMVSFILFLLGPICVRRLYGGTATESEASLPGLEGTMPIQALETIIFGNRQDRLVYTQSATPLGEQDPNICWGIEPQWITDPENHQPPPLFHNHSLFTLIDTGRLRVTVFSAEKPPTFALLCGHDGGMLRAVLCSWDFANDCLYKEAVVRMLSDVWESAKPKSWLKLCLHTRPFIWEQGGKMREQSSWSSGLGRVSAWFNKLGGQDV